jgi:Rad3-related DNA helicase
VNLIKNFPTNFNPTHNQTNAINAIDQAFTDGYKFVIVRAPTGSGKSFISKTIANSSEGCTTTYRDLITSYLAFKQSGMGYEYEEECLSEPESGCFALTVTKTLQDQYKQFFDDTKLLKGKSNYYCEIDKNYSVETAPCVHIKKLKDECWRKDFCTYYRDRNEALTNKFAALNYKMFFSLPSHVKKREYIICDEASELEDELVKEFTCIIDSDFLDTCDVDFYSSNISTSDYAKSYRGVEQLSLALLERIKEIDGTIKDNEKLTTYLEGEKKKMIGLKNLHNKLQLLISSWNDSEYIIEKVNQLITFTPLKINKLTKHLFDYGTKIILMSATIIDERNFAKTLGIDNYKFIDVQSTFDSKKAPIYVNTKHKLNAYTIKTTLPTIAEMVKKICESHSGDKGIVHTHTLEITKAIKQQCTGSRFLFRDQGVQNDEILKEHFESDNPTVLVSPSLTHGIDLKDDLARFQIIVKAPFLPLTNKRIKTLFDGDKQWYQNKMLCSLVQACGRGIRSVNDHCVTYILDATVLDALRNNVNILPRYFIERFV